MAPSGGALHEEVSAPGPSDGRARQRGGGGGRGGTLMDRGCSAPRAESGSKLGRRGALRRGRGDSPRGLRGRAMGRVWGPRVHCLPDRGAVTEVPALPFP